MELNKKLLLLDWMRKIHTLEYAHRFESLMWNNISFYLGLLSFICSVLIGVTSACKESSTISLISFVANNKELIVFLGGLFTAIFTGLLTFLKPSEFSEKHRQKSLEYEKLRHRIEYLIEFYDVVLKFEEELKGFREDWAKVDGLNVANKNFNKAKKKVAAFKKYREELGFLETVE